MKITGRTDIGIVHNILLIKNAPAVVAPRPQTGHLLLSLSFQMFLSLPLRLDFVVSERERKE